MSERSRPTYSSDFRRSNQMGMNQRVKISEVIDSIRARFGRNDTTINGAESLLLDIEHESYQSGIEAGIETGRKEERQTQQVIANFERKQLLMKIAIELAVSE